MGRHTVPGAQQQWPQQVLSAVQHVEPVCVLHWTPEHPHVPVAPLSVQLWSSGQHLSPQALVCAEHERHESCGPQMLVAWQIPKLHARHSMLGLFGHGKAHEDAGSVAPPQTRTRTVTSMRSHTKDPFAVVGIR
jgi:hypothetical protein